MNDANADWERLVEEQIRKGTETNELGTFFSRINDNDAACSLRPDAEGSRWRAGTVEASHFNDGVWMICRAIVRSEGDRSKGVGSFMLQRVIGLILEREPNATIEVTPGGYGSDPKAQARFYERNGFVEASEGLYIYRRPSERESSS